MPNNGCSTDNSPDGTARCTFPDDEAFGTVGVSAPVAFGRLAPEFPATAPLASDYLIMEQCKDGSGLGQQQTDSDQHS
jgi:hypothetical protein